MIMFTRGARFYPLMNLEDATKSLHISRKSTIQIRCLILTKQPFLIDRGFLTKTFKITH